MSSVTYSELCELFAKKTGYSIEVAKHQLDVLRGLIGTLVVEGHAVTLPNVIALKPVQKPARPSCNRLGRMMPAAPAHMAVKAVVSKKLKDAVKARWEGA